MKFLMLLPSLFLLLTQPFSMSLILTMQTVFLSLVLYTNLKNIWMSLVLILVIVGGLMMSFVYVCSLMPKESYTRSSTWITPFMFSFLFFLSFMPVSFQFNNLSVENFPLTLFTSLSFSSVLFTILILLLALLVVCAMTLQVKNPMRTFL